MFSFGGLFELIEGGNPLIAKSQPHHALCSLDAVGLGRTVRQLRENRRVFDEFAAHGRLLPIVEHFGGRAVALIGASPGGFGTILAQEAWLPVLRTLGTRPWFGGRLMASRAQTLFSTEGVLTDDALRKQLTDFVQGFASFIAAGAAR